MATEGQAVVLRGGWPERAGSYRLPEYAAGNASRAVMAFCGRHQRFEPSGESEPVEDRSLPVFRFACSTASAE
ncbi:DUF5988 family protein [Streptomyces spectabilis]|uniref:Uncharacterized protein n=1 Tax=Streptomyces spectabilis TaxID=68270 RepID=A0A516R1S0_STRST|nr:DUF5988 family protein [Streptomyces spectabilis]QDQ09605.1 hypothetical protein FH965_02720 [Streptomyces spectabilis]